MNDLQRFQALVESFGIGHETDTDAAGHTHISFTQGEAKVIGYAGFVSVWDFDSAGNFHSVGAWE